VLIFGSFEALVDTDAYCEYLASQFVRLGYVLVQLLPRLELAVPRQEDDYLRGVGGHGGRIAELREGAVEPLVIVCEIRLDAHLGQVVQDSSEAGFISLQERRPEEELAIVVPAHDRDGGVAEMRPCRDDLGALVWSQMVVLFHAARGVEGEDYNFAVWCLNYNVRGCICREVVASFRSPIYLDEVRQVPVLGAVDLSYELDVDRFAGVKIFQGPSYVTVVCDVSHVGRDDSETCWEGVFDRYRGEVYRSRIRYADCEIDQGAVRSP